MVGIGEDAWLMDIFKVVKETCSVAEGNVRSGGPLHYNIPSGDTAGIGITSEGAARLKICRLVIEEASSSAKAMPLISSDSGGVALALTKCLESSNTNTSVDDWVTGAFLRAHMPMLADVLVLCAVAGEGVHGHTMCTRDTANPAGNKMPQWLGGLFARWIEMLDHKRSRVMAMPTHTYDSMTFDPQTGVDRHAAHGAHASGDEGQQDFFSRGPYKQERVTAMQDATSGARCCTRADDSCVLTANAMEGITGIQTCDGGARNESTSWMRKMRNGRRRCT